MPTYPKNVLVNLGAIGGSGGGAVEFLAQTGGLVERVGVWASGKDIIGVSVKFSNDEKINKMGSGEWGDYSEFIFEDASETVKSLSLWGNGQGTNLGRIKFTTSKGRTFDCGGHGGKTEYPMDVGSGLWVGIRGNCGATVDNMSVFFLTRVDSMKIKDVKFKNDPTGTSQGIKPKVLKSAQFPWHGKPYDYKFERPRIETESHTVTETKSHSTALALGLTEEWKGEVNLFFAKTDLTITASEQMTFTWTTENSTTDTTQTTDGMTPGVSGKITGPDDAIVVEAVTYTGSLDLEYTATIEVKMASGASYNIPTNGTMKKMAYSKMYMNVRPIDEDTTLPPSENEERSFEEKPFENNQENRSGEEQYQEDQGIAWSPAENADEQDQRLEACFTNRNPDDDTYQNFEESREQDEESQENPERQQRRGYNQQEYQAQDHYEQNQDDSRQYQDDFQQNENNYEQDQDNSQPSQNQRYRSNDYEATEEGTSGRYAEYGENEPVMPMDQQEDRSDQQWNSERQDNTESYDSCFNGQDENQGEQNNDQFEEPRRNDDDRRNTQSFQVGQRYGDELTLGEDERTYAPVEQETSRRGYNNYGDEKEASGYVEEEPSYRDDYQQQGNAWRGNRDEAVF
jgi:hypothetical protein